LRNQVWRRLVGGRCGSRLEDLRGIIAT
jgi:hypothetical protein